MSKRNRPVTKDMYWFAHGGSEALMDKNLIEEENESKSLGREEQKSSKDISLTDGSNSSGPPSLEREDRLHAADRRVAVEERRKILWEAEQEKNDAMMRKHMEREAALEARRNAQRSTISFAFGSSVPRNVDTLQSNHSVEMDCMSRSYTAASSSHRAELHNNFYDRRSVSPIYTGGPHMVNGTSHQPDSSLSTYSAKKSYTQSGCLVGSGAIIVEDVMSKSMTASISAPRGRRKNDLMPTVPYDRAAAPRVATSSSSRRRSVSMTRLDQLAQPRKHYFEATTKANSTTSSMLKDVCSLNRPLSSASEQSGGRAASNVTRRVRPSRKPRPISIAGTIPDQKHTTSLKLHEVKGSAIKKTPVRKTEAADVKKAPSTIKSATPKSTPRPAHALVKTSTPKSTTPKTVAPKPKTPLTKEKTPSSVKPQTSKTSAVNKKKSDVQVSSTKSDDVKVDKTEKSGSPLPDSDSGQENDKNSKRIISEEEARTALAEKRRLAREQAEKEAELERQRQEELRRQEEEQLRKEEEEQRKMEEESLRLLEEHRRQEEEKLRKAIEDQEQKKVEERVRQEEESRLKAEQDKKAKEESEKIRLELEDKLRREEEERAERKKRLEKIMSRTRGKSSGTSPSGSVSGSDHMDSGESQQEGFSSGANSLESNEGPNSPNEPITSDDVLAKMEVSSSGGNSLEAYELSSNDVSLNSNDLMLSGSEVSFKEDMVAASDKESSCHESAEKEASSSAVTPVNVVEEIGSNSDQLTSDTQGNLSPSVLEEEKISSEVDSITSKNPEEFEIPTTSNTNETSSGHVQPEQKLLEGALVDNSEKPNPFEDSELVKEQLHNEASELHNSEYNPFGTETFKQADEINPFTENTHPTTVTESGEDLANIDFLGVDHTMEVGESISNNAHENFESTLEEKASPPDNQSIPTDHHKEVSSEDQVSFEPSPAIDSKPDHSFEADQDPFLHSVAQGEIPVSDAEKLDQDFVEQPREIGENLFIPCETSVFTEEKDVPSGTALSTAEEQVQFLEGNAYSFSSENHNSNFDVLNDGEAARSKHLHSAFLSNSNGAEDVSEAFKTAAGMNVTVDNPFASNSDGAGDANEAFKAAPGVNVTVDNPFASNFDCAGDASRVFDSEKTADGVNLSVDNSFVSKNFPNEYEQNIFSSQFGDYDPKDSEFVMPEHVSLEEKIIEEPSDLKNELNNVTLITKEGSEKYIGIISSLDNDRFSNDFPNKLNEHSGNNLECASTTDDSEDSSLDSNLSQVIAPEDGEKDLKNHTYSDHQTSNNTDNPFMNHQNQSSIPQSGVDHYSEFAVYSNGHSMESSKMVTDYGNSILSVESNIFENVGAIDKISSDPFPGKGSSNQIPGNPFLLQEEQNNSKVLMTSDFLN